VFYRSQVLEPNVGVVWYRCIYNYVYMYTYICITVTNMYQSHVTTVTQSHMYIYSYVCIKCIYIHTYVLKSHTCIRVTLPLWHRVTCTLCHMYIYSYICIQCIYIHTYVLMSHTCIRVKLPLWHKILCDAVSLSSCDSDTFMWLQHISRICRGSSQSHTHANAMSCHTHIAEDNLIPNLDEHCLEDTRLTWCLTKATQVRGHHSLGPTFLGN